MLRHAALLAAALGADARTHTEHMRAFGKSYPPAQQARRAQVYAENMALAAAHNAQPGVSWLMGENEFADWTSEEFRAQRTGTRPMRSGVPMPAASRAAPAADAVDWRTKSGVLTNVKDQKSCGSCWAFSAVETYESAVAIATGTAAPVLSEQQVVDCAPNPDHCGGTGGCEGSTQQLAFKYLEGPGITTEAAYSYKGRDGTCKSKITPAATNTGYTEVPTNDYNAHIAAVTAGPVAITVAAASWQMYRSGIYNKKDYTLDHGVQLVGYGADGDKLYWIVRNSWGASWGESGFIRLARYGDGKEPCGDDKAPADGIACKGNSTVVSYCGTSGMLSSTSYPTGVKAAAADRFHCDTTTQTCVSAVSGHSTMDKCTAACK